MNHVLFDALAPIGSSTIKASEGGSDAALFAALMKRSSNFVASLSAKGEFKELYDRQAHLARLGESIAGPGGKT